jgi:putative FmdB family regulatory protein
MPLYEYECESCGHRLERIQKFSDPPLETCPDCGGKLRKLISSPAIQFKGSGWYITDYSRKGSSESSKSESGESKKSDSTSTDKSSSSTTSSTSETKPSTPGSSSGSTDSKPTKS